MKLKIVTIVVSIVVCTAVAAYLIYNFYYPSKAESTTRSIEFGSSNSSGDFFMNELVVGISDINDLVLIDSFLSTFNSLPVFVRLVNPDAGVVNSPNFDRIQSAGHFWYFSAPSYSSLRSLAQAYYAKYPDGRVILELTNHDARSNTETQSLTAAFPKAKFVAANYVNWNREKVKELVNTSMPNHLTHPSLHAVSFYLDATGGLSNIPEDVSLFWDTIWDASTDTAGKSIKVEWPTKAYFFALPEIKTTARSGAERIKDEARRLGILVTVYYNYPQMRGDDSRVNNNIPIRYSGLGDFGSLSPSGKSIAAVFAHISKHKMAGVYPVPQTGFNYRFQSSPLFGVGGYAQNSGHAFVFSNASDDNFTVQFPSSFPSSQYSTISTIRGSQQVLGADNKIVFEPFEVVAIYKTGSLSLPPGGGGTTPSVTNTPTVTVSGTVSPPPPTTTSTVTPTTTNAATPTRTNTPSRTPTATKSATPTATPTPTSTPVPTATNIPTPTFTPTLAPTSTPTPILAAFCESKECGVCGWKDTSGVCHSDGALPDGKKCCFSTCISNSCKFVSGFGADRCTDDASCIEPTAIVKYVVIEPSISQSQNSQNVVNSATITKTVLQNQNNTSIAKASPAPQPPVSGDAKSLMFIIIPAIVLVLGAIIL